jgi:hypothetical protein
MAMNARRSSVYKMRQGNIDGYISENINSEEILMVGVIFTRQLIQFAKFGIIPRCPYSHPWFFTAGEDQADI